MLRILVTMADPANVARVTVTGTWRLPLADGTTVPATGYVVFAPTTRLQDGGSSEILPVAPVRAVLDVTGHISVTLMATDDVDLAPSGWGYQITEYVGGTTDTYFATFPAAAPTVDLSTVAPASVTPLNSYVSLSAVGAPTGVASLDVTGNVPLAQLGNAPSGGGTPSGTVSASAVGDAGAAGASANYSRGDHVHARESYGLPAASAVGDTQSAGAATTDARSDHRHAREGFGTPGNSAVGDAAAAGSAATVAHSDHVHGRESYGAVVAQTSYGAASANGTATTDARSDHAHGTPALTAVTPAASAEGDTGAVGTGTAPAREDHRHAREAFGGAPGTTLGIGQAGAAGAATTPSRSDHAHPLVAAGAPGASAVGDTQSTGVATTFAASDHRHARESFGAVTAQVTYGAASANGVATTDARSDHAHGTVPAPPSVTTPNLISGAWYAVPGQGSVGTTGTLAAGTALFVPLTPQLAATLSGLAVEITTVDGSGVVRFGLATETAGLPATWLDDYGTVSATGLGLVQPASTPSRVLSPLTRVWIGIVPQGGTGALVLRDRSGSLPDIALTTTSTATPGALNSARNAYTSTGWTAALSGAITVAGVTLGPVVEARLT